jgi:imidazolonepropionase
MILIDNIGVLATLSPLGEIHDAAVLIDGETIAWCGKKTDLPKKNIAHTIDAKGYLVTPGLIDCHTHLLFAGSRADEFARRMNHESYQTIMAKGGGIVSTVQATREASDQALLALAQARLDQMLAMGVTTVEAKSGYGLNLEQELRALRLLQQLDAIHRIDIHKTYLGAHVIPNEYTDTREQYIGLLMDMLEKLAVEGLADDCDVFCEQGAFSVTEAKTVLGKAHTLGLGLRAHVQQLSHSGGVALVRELPLKSISHADFLSNEDIKMIADSGVVVEALPIAALFLRSQTITPIEKLLASSVSLAIATDFNPGSAMCQDLVLASRIGVVYFGFPIPHALAAITRVAAQSLGYADRGIIQAGLIADFLITNCHSINEFFYDWTKHPAGSVIKRGNLC